VNPVLHEHLADRFRDAFEERISIVAEGEDIRVEGRVVDCAEGITSVSMVGVIPFHLAALGQRVGCEREPYADGV